MSGLSHETWLLYLVTLAVAITLIAVLANCICGCRKTVPKNELMGLAGMVKITNPEESLNHNVGDEAANESAACTVIGGGRSCADTTDPNKRTSTTANRSLPDIPVDSERVCLDSGDTLWESNEPNGDTCSELYATVQENKSHLQPLVSMQSSSSSSSRGMKHSAAATSDDGKSSEHSSLSQTDDSFSPYAQLKSEHPYDQLKKSEHPYAQVGTSIDRRNDQPETSTRGRFSGPAGSVSMNPVPPPRTRKSNSFNSLIATQDTDTPSTSIIIPAATAIAGRISANQELPYMTPPIPTPAMVPDPQAHFSGDSQDSSKGYTSISVREPLANIKAQTRQRSRTQELSDSLYATVSDDSEEMYAAIEDPAPVYTSGSETYAQIQPLVVAEPPAPQSESAEIQHNPPQPPSVDSLKQVAHVHSRQASSSSANSSVANLGSPKPEKRQANSPLPPPPAGSPELYATVDKKTGRELQPEKSIEEMYAKVMKKKLKGSVDLPLELQSDSVDHNETRVLVSNTLEENRLSSLELDSKGFISDVESTASMRDNASSTSIDNDISSSRESIEARQRIDSDTNSNSSSNPNLHFEISRKESTRPQVIPNSLQPTGNYERFDGFSSIPYVDPGYEVVQRGRLNPPSDCDPNYEELHPQVTDEQDFPSYFSVNSEKGSGEPGYASIVAPSRDRSSTVPGYESIGHPRHRSSTRYESVGDVVERSFRVDPGYEQVGAKSFEAGTANVSQERTSLTKFDGGEDPNYESMGHSNQDLNYTGGSESDPNYEVVRHEDPNYESVNYSNSSSDPPYKILHNDSKDSDSETMPGYERVNVSSSKQADSCREAEYEEVDVDVKVSGNGDVWKAGTQRLI